MKELVKYIFYWFILHCIFYGIEQAHHFYCTPSGAIGFIQSIFTSNSQVCVCLRNASYLTSNASANLFTIMSIYILNQSSALFNCRKRNFQSSFISGNENGCVKVK